MDVPEILAFPPYRISCGISLKRPWDIVGHKWNILPISIGVREITKIENSGIFYVFRSKYFATIGPKPFW